MSIAVDLAAALDPVVMLRRSGVEPDPWQQNLLRSTAPRTLLNCCRQSGKSTTSAAVAIHAALYQAPILVLVLSPSLRQSKEFFTKCLDLYRTLGRPIPADTENKMELALENGSRIVSLPGKETTIRGFSGVGLLIIDEAARVVEELYRSVRPMLAVSGGRLIALSTPWGRRGWFWQAWESGVGWERFEIPASMCPRISAEFLAEERRELGDLWFRSEYLCQFVDTVDAVFRTEELDAALSHDVAPLFGAGM